MEELYNLLSSSARLDKRKKNEKKRAKIIHDQRRQERVVPPNRGNDGGRRKEAVGGVEQAAHDDGGGEEEDDIIGSRTSNALLVNAGSHGKDDDDGDHSSDDSSSVVDGEEEDESESEEEGDAKLWRSSNGNNDDDDNTKKGANKRKTKKKRKKEHNAAKQRQIHREEIAAFRRRMNIRVNHRTTTSIEEDCPDPISSFEEITQPHWWQLNDHDYSSSQSKSSCSSSSSFDATRRTILSNIEDGKWTEPTPIQMQCLPSLFMGRRDTLGAAPTGSGKSGAFILPALMLARAPSSAFYYGDDHGDHHTTDATTGNDNDNGDGSSNLAPVGTTKEGEIRTLLLAPSRELASQLHREVQRLGHGLVVHDDGGAGGTGDDGNKAGGNQKKKSNRRKKKKRAGDTGVRSVLLSKANAHLLLDGKLGGKRGLDVLVTTPLRLCAVFKQAREEQRGSSRKALDCLKSVRLVVLDEADRLLDATDGSSSSKALPAEEAAATTASDDVEGSVKPSVDDDDSGSSSEDEDHSAGEEEEGDTGKDRGAITKKRRQRDEDDDKDEQRRQQQQQQQQHQQRQSGSAHVQTFVEQIDDILSHCPPSAIRALFSATMGPNVRTLAESILRSPLDVTVGSMGTSGATVANPDIDQQLLFVGREEGKLLALRQMFQNGTIRPPVLVFLQSKERAQALFGELLYDGVHVDVLHAGRSPSAREETVSKFRRGETWVLLCTDLVARGVDFRAVNMVINYDLPTSGVSYVHRIGRTGRAGRKGGKAITMFTEADMDQMRVIANVMKLSGCRNVPDWILSMKKGSGGNGRKNEARERKRLAKSNPRRGGIDTTPSYDTNKRRKRMMSIENSRKGRKKHPKEGGSS